MNTRFRRSPFGVHFIDNGIQEVTDMSKTIENGISGATFGGILGGALGTLLTGVTLFIPGLNIIVAPVAIAAAATAATTVTVSGAALGTAIGGTAGVISGAVEDSRNNDNKGGN